MREAALFRSRMIGAIRTFFDDRSYLEVDTPTLSPTLIPEANIENFATCFINPFMEQQELFLLPSPEIYMKRLIADGWGSLYQISHCFRNSEQVGHLHNPEFTMLEYYTVGADEVDSIVITEELFAHLLPADAPEHLRPPFAKMSVAEATKRFTGIDLDAHQDQSKLAEAARSLGLMFAEEKESWEETFNRIFLTLVEPKLPQERPLVLDRYPKQIECLAVAEGAYRRRWELYVGGMELANCYNEERDPETIATYLREEHETMVAQRSASGMPLPPVDEQLVDIFSSMEQVSGVAMGLDRLQMLLMGRSSIDEVLLFPFSEILNV